jgi:hypothetical protein
MNLRRAGGWSAWVLAAAYLVGIALNFTLLDASAIADPVGKVAFLAERQSAFHAFMLLVYIAFAVALVFFALALEEQTRAAGNLSRAGTAFALIWAGLLLAAGNVYISGMNAVVAALGADAAQAGTVWAAVDAVHVGLSGTSELPGALWTLLISAAMLRARAFPRGLAYLGLAVGAAGLLTLIPALFMPAVMAYALGHCAWWVGLGVALLRKGEEAATNSANWSHAQNSWRVKGSPREGSDPVDAIKPG